MVQDMDRQLCEQLRKVKYFVESVKWNGDRLVITLKIPSLFEKTAREIIECIK